MKIVSIKKNELNEAEELNKQVVEIKVSECNLDCTNCIDVEFRETNWQKYSVDTILKKISEFENDFVLITGGEPLMYFETPIICNALYSMGKKVYLKTNGTGPLENIPAHTVKIINFKLPSTGEGGSFFFENLLYMTGNDYLKFEIQSKQDLDFAMETVNKLAPAKVVFTFIFKINKSNVDFIEKVKNIFCSYADLKYTLKLFE